MPSSNSKTKRRAYDEAITEGHASNLKRARLSESNPSLNSMPSQSLPPPERPESLQNHMLSWNDDDEVEEIPRAVEAGYTYKGLRRGEFRLLRLHAGKPGDVLHCSLVTDSIDTPSCYEALSYVWGRQHSMQEILLSDESELGFSSPTHFQVGPNLHSALLAVRIPDRPRLLWVDAICINQFDHVEKSSQIPIMGEIFKKACCVLVWLGNLDTSSDFLLPNLRQVFRPGFFSRDGDDRSIAFRSVSVDATEQALSDLFSRPWWSRAWIIQEMVLAKEITFVVGQRQIDLEDLRVAAELFSARHGTVDDTRRTPLDEVATLLNGRNDILRTSSSGTVIANTMSIAQLVLQFRGSGVTDPRDIIFSLLGLANDAHTISVDYSKSSMQVFSDFISTRIEHQGLLDLILIPWAPVKRSKNTRNGHYTDPCKEFTTPSWLAALEDLPYGLPEVQDQSRHLSKRRVNGDELVDLPGIYDASYGMKPEARFGPITKNRRLSGEHGVQDNSETGNGAIDNPVLHVRGIQLGIITDLSTRMADGLVSRDALELAGVPFTKGCDALHTLSEATTRNVWRTLVCDRDANGRRAPTRFGLALKHLSKRMLESPGLDTLEMLKDGNEMDSNTFAFLNRVHSAVFNRRIFVSDINEFKEHLLGQAPKNARKGDTIALLFGNSVPVILRLSCDGGAKYMKIVGPAYVDGKMQGEILHELGESRIDEIAQTFDII